MAVSWLRKLSSRIAKPQTKPGVIRSVTSESGRVYMTLRLDGDMVAMRFTKPGVNDFDILFDQKAMPQMIEIFKEFCELETANGK